MAGGNGSIVGAGLYASGGTGNKRGIDIGVTGAGSSNIAVMASSYNTGATSNYAVYADVSNTSGTNVGIYASAAGGTSNYAIVVPSAGGNVGLGTTTPAAKLSIHGGHIKSTQATIPVFNVVSLGGLTSAVLDASSTDIKGSIACSGGIPAGNVATFKITFSTSYNVAPIAVACAAGSGSLDLNVIVEATNTSDMTISIKNPTGAGINNPRINYFVIE